MKNWYSIPIHNMTKVMTPKGDNPDEMSSMNHEENECLEGDNIKFDVNIEETFAEADADDKKVKERCSENVFQCEICQKVFAKKLYLTVHMRIHSGARPFSCHLCDKTFRQQSALSRHFIIHKMDGSFACDKCGFFFKTKLAIDLHKCILASPKAASNKIKHIRRSPKVFECEICGKKMSRKDKYQQHLMLHSGMKPFKCQTCGKLFRQRNHLQRHSFLHTDKKPYICDVCGMSFIENQNLKEHARLHSGEMPYECSVCDKKFARSQVLRKHLITVHKGESMYSCSKCSRLFTFYKTYERHNCMIPEESGLESLVTGHVPKLNSQINEFDDDRREAILITGDNLLTNGRDQGASSSDERDCVKISRNTTEMSSRQILSKVDIELERMPFVVPSPNESISVNSVMNKTAHPFFYASYACGVCGREFKRCEYLTRHMQIHTGDRPYACKYCGVTFTQSAHCRAHERIHDNIRPYSCEICSKRFITSSDLKKHGLVHVKGTPFVCKDCGKSFKCIKYLNGHSYRMHSLPGSL